MACFDASSKTPRSLPGMCSSCTVRAGRFCTRRQAWLLSTLVAVDVKIIGNIREELYGELLTFEAPNGHCRSFSKELYDK